MDLKKHYLDMFFKINPAFVVMSIDCSHFRPRHSSGKTLLHSDDDVCRQQKMEMWFGITSLKLFDDAYFRSQNSENLGFLGSRVDAELVWQNAGETLVFSPNEYKKCLILPRCGWGKQLEF